RCQWGMLWLSMLLHRCLLRLTQRDISSGLHDMLLAQLIFAMMLPLLCRWCQWGMMWLSVLLRHCLLRHVRGLHDGLLAQLEERQPLSNGCL
ncbi:hypothetical protein H5410_054147, partial [Solanum commersonii]